MDKYAVPEGLTKDEYICELVDRSILKTCLLLHKEATNSRKMVENIKQTTLKGKSDGAMIAKLLMRAEWFDRVAIWLREENW